MKLGQLLAIPIALFALKTFTEQISDTKPTVVTPTPVPKVIVTPATPVPTPASVTNGFVIGPAGTTIDPIVFPEKLDLFGPTPKEDACPYGFELQYDGSCKRTGLGGL